MSIGFPTITRRKSKQIKALQQKKRRKEEGLFVVEGLKSVQELLASDYIVIDLVVTTEMIENLSQKAIRKIPTHITDQATLASIGSLKSNEGILAIARCKGNKAIDLGSNTRLLVLDHIQNPSNLGALIRIADWYGLGRYRGFP